MSDPLVVRPKDVPKKILRPNAVSEKVGLSKTTIWRRERDGDFPRRLQLGGKAVGWHESEVDEWIETRARTKSET